MNDKDAQNKQIEDLLRAAHPSEPSSQLQERITVEAKRAWNEAPEELSWLIPIGRLVASVAAAVFVVWLANYSSDRTLTQWSSGAVHAASQQPADIEALSEMPYSRFVMRLASLDRRSSTIGASALIDHAETLRRILNEALQGGSAKPPAPARGRSRLIPDRQSANSYS